MSLIKVQFNKLDLESHKTVNMAVTYQEYDQGVIKNNPHEPMRTCSQDFLQVLVSDLAAIHHEYKVHYSKMSQSAVKLGLQKIWDECKRLAQSRELFHNELVADAFFGMIERISGQILRLDTAWRRHINRQRILTLFLARRYQRRSRRHFAKDRKEWQQFLGRDAPGSGTGIRAPSRNMSCQIIPWAGVKILCGWTKECKDIIKTIEDKRDGAPITQPGTQLTNNHVRIGLDGNITRVRQYFVAPNPFFTTVRRRPEMSAAGTDLARLGQTMGGFDHEVAHAPRITGRMIPTVIIQKMIPPKKGGGIGQ